MASEAVPAGNANALLRLQRRLVRPAVYLMLFGGLQLAYLWALRSYLGLPVPVIATLGFAGLLVLVRHPRVAWRWKVIALGALVIVMSVVPLAVLMANRQHQGLTIEYDGLTQDEISIDRLMHGHPIYGVGFAGTPMEGYRWIYDGLDLRDYQHLPLMPMAGVPVRVLADLIHAPFDYRMVLLVFVGIAAAAVAAIPIALPGRFLLGVVLFLDPLISVFLFTGHDDICMAAMLLVSLALLARGHPLWASLALGTAAAFKPFAVFVLPFLLLAVWLRWPGRVGRLALCLTAVAVPPLVTIVPFLIVDAGAFWREVVLFGTGSGAGAYPISGFGFPALLLQVHVITRQTDAYPALPLQLVAVVPILWVGLRALSRRPTLARLLAGSIGVTVAFLVFARFFSDNYVATLFALAACVPALGLVAAIGPAGPPALEMPVSSRARAA